MMSGPYVPFRFRHSPEEPVAHLCFQGAKKATRSGQFSRSSNRCTGCADASPSLETRICDQSELWRLLT